MSIKLTSNNVFLIGVSFRLIICIFFIILPFDHENYGKLNPLTYQYFADLNFYFKYFKILDLNSDYTSRFIEVYKNLIFFNYNGFYEAINSSITDYRFPGPFYPAILYITFYSKNFTFLLAFIVLITELITLRIWINYLNEKISIKFLLVFVFLPFPLILGLLHSSDVFFYFFSTIIFLIIKKNIRFSNQIFLIVMILIATIRPASITIFLAIVFYEIISKNRNLYYLIISIFCLIISSFYYQPYYLVEREIVSSALVLDKFASYFYLNNELINNTIYYFTKLFFLFGFHPSSSGSILVYIIRVIPGMVLLVGFLYSLKNYKSFDFFYLNLTVIPIVLFLYPAWRYIIPISPLLYLYFVKFLNLYLIKK